MMIYRFKNVLQYTKNIIIISSLLLLAACAKSGNEIRESADKIASENGFYKKLVQGEDFLLTTYQKITDSKAPYVFYIESDGYAFTNYGVSENPTPRDSLLLKLAIMDKRPNVVYLARPCQYTPMELNPKCAHSTEYWTNKRLSEEVVVSVNTAIESIRNNKPVSLIGYSGGGGVALLVAARSKYVKDIITIAGNIDTVSFTEFHAAKYDPQKKQLSGSLNPADYAESLKTIPQLHISGGNDKKVPPFIAARYVQKSSSTCVHQKIYPSATHSKGWQAIWGSVLNTPLQCK